MGSTARKTIALLLAVVAVLCAAAGLVARSADRLVNTPEPLQQILGPLATNEQLRQVLPQELGTQLTRQITANLPVPVPSALRGVLEGAISTASSALINDAGFAAAWDATIESARSSYVEQLAAAAGDGTEQVSITLDVAPLLESAYGTLKSSLAGSALGLLLPQTITMPPVPVDTNWPDAATLSAPEANAWLGFAAAWGWLLAGAGVLLAAALLVAPQGFRGSTLVATGVVAVLVAGLVIVLGGRLGEMSAQPDELANLVVTQLVSGLRAEMRGISDTLLAGGAAALLAALGSWLWRRKNPVKLG